MKIAVNTRLLIRNRLEGIGWFTYESLSRITRQHPEHEFYFIFDRKFDDEFVFSPNVHPIVLPPQARHPLLYYAWFEIALPLLLKRLKPDLFLSTDGYLPLKTKIRTVNVFHDLNFEHYPNDLPLTERSYYQHFFPKYAQKADRIATVSEYSKKDIIQLYGIAASKIDVIYDGAGDFFQPVKEEIKSLVRQKYAEGSEYFLFVGALHPRKNLINLFKAFERFKQMTSGKHKLLVVGEKKWWTQQIREAYEQCANKKEIIFTGRLNSGELSQVMASAFALTYVSYFEGFGIPIVEAFRCGVPVITSNVTSMPEIAGDAAFLVDPFNVESIAEAMAGLYSDPLLREDLVERGNRRKDLFTWEKTAERLWQTIEKTLNQ